MRNFTVGHLNLCSGDHRTWCAQPNYRALCLPFATSSAPSAGSSGFFAYANGVLMLAIGLGLLVKRRDAIA